MPIFLSHTRVFLEQSRKASVYPGAVGGTVNWLSIVGRKFGHLYKLLATWMVFKMEGIHSNAYTLERCGAVKGNEFQQFMPVALIEGCKSLHVKGKMITH